MANKKIEKFEVTYDRQIWEPVDEKTVRRNLAPRYCGWSYALIALQNQEFVQGEVAQYRVAKD